MNINETLDALYKTTFHEVLDSRLCTNEINKSWNEFKKNIYSLLDNDNSRSFTNISKFFNDLGINNNDLREASIMQEDSLNCFIILSFNEYLQKLERESYHEMRLRERSPSIDKALFYSTIKKFCNSSNKRFNNYINNRINLLLQQ